MKHSDTRSHVGGATLLVLCVLALGLGLPAVAAADNEAGNLEFIIVSDDIRKSVAEVERPGGDGSPAAAPAPATAPGGADPGKNNNGHGNNEDGVDSSNPGQGKGGPNGGVDPSGDVDDEAGGGGASPSKGKKK